MCFVGVRLIEVVVVCFVGAHLIEVVLCVL